MIPPSIVLLDDFIHQMAAVYLQVFLLALLVDLAVRRFVPISFMPWLSPLGVIIWGLLLVTNYSQVSL